MEIWGYIASLFIGVLLGLIGGGGSILTVPIMVYLFHMQPLLATSYSLFIVGVTSLTGAVKNIKKGQVNIKAALLFGTASVITVFFTRKFILQAIPKNIFTVGTFTLTSSLFIMLLFAALMLISAIGMIRNNGDAALQKNCSPYKKVVLLLAYGIAIGLLTGLLGAGGGFLFIPALVFLLKLPVKEAIGTSLLIIALNSLVGFLADVGHFSVNWPFLFIISIISITGIFIGSYINKRMEGDKLKKGFGWFVLVMGVYIIIKEVFVKS